MSRNYYVVETGDGEALSKEVATLKEARAEKKRIVAEDKKLGIDEYFISSYIIGKYEETDTQIIFMGEVK